MVSNVKMQWVVARYEGEQAKKVLAHTTSYQVLQQGSVGKSQWVIAAFLSPFDDVLPAHLTPVTDPEKIAKLNAMYKQLHGAQTRPTANAELMSPSKEALRDWWKKRRQAKETNKRNKELINQL